MRNGPSDAMTMVLVWRERNHGSTGAIRLSYNCLPKDLASGAALRNAVA